MSKKSSTFAVSNLKNKKYMSITNQMSNAFNLFSNGNKEKAEQIILQTIMSANPIDFYAWWLTETNPDYMLSSKDFLIFIKNIVISNQDKITTNI